MRIGPNTSWRTGRGRRWWWTTGGVIVAVVLSGSAAAYALAGDGAEPSQPAATVRVDRGNVTLAIATTGALQPAQTRSLGFGGDGTVTEVKVRPGDQVAAGQLLAQLDGADAQQRVDSAQDGLTQAQTALDAAVQRQDAPPSDSCGTGGGGGGGGGGAGVAVTPVAWVSPTPGAGTPTPTPTGSAQPSQPPQSDPPTQSTSPGQSGKPAPSAPPGGSNQSAPPGRSGQPAGGSPTCTSQQPAAGSDQDPVLRAQQQVSTAQLTLATATDALTGTKITAPIAGKVLTVAAGVGATVSGTSTFMTLGDVAGMAVAASFPEADAGRLAVGLVATVTLANRPGEELPAKVTQVDPVGTANGQLVRYGALLDFDKVPADALVGQSANARVTVQSAADVLRVPVTAVHLTAPAAGAEPPGATGTATAGSTGTVWLRTPAGGTESRQVTVGLRGDQYLELTAGLAEGDEVLLNW